VFSSGYSRILSPLALLVLAAALFLVDAGTPATGQAVYQVNCGGYAVSGTSWIADAYFSGGYTWWDITNIDNSSVVNPAPQAVYQTVRLGCPPYSYNGGSFSYIFPTLTPGGAYTVRFHLADLGEGGSAPGTNLITLSVNGTTVRNNYAVDDNAGAAFKALTIAADTTADSSGNITVNVSGTRMAFCNGIEILTGSLPTITTTPTGLKASTDLAANLSWNAVNGATGYNILRSTTSSGPFVRVNPTTVTTTTYSDSVCGEYYYEVLAVNDLGEGPPCKPVFATPTTTTAFALSVTPASITVARGSNVALTISASQPCHSGTAVLSLSGVPAGVVAFCYPSIIAFVDVVSQPPILFPSPVLLPTDGANSVLNIFVGSNAVPGTYQLTLTGKTGIFTTSATVPLTIN